MTEEKLPKYTVWTSTHGKKMVDTEDDVWEFIGAGQIGQLYEVRYTETSEYVPEFVPF